MPLNKNESNFNIVRIHASIIFDVWTLRGYFKNRGPRSVPSTNCPSTKCPSRSVPYTKWAPRSGHHEVDFHEVARTLKFLPPNQMWVSCILSKVLTIFFPTIWIQKRGGYTYVIIQRIYICPLKSVFI